MTTPIVTICGSMRFYDLMLTVAADETRAGRMVLMPFAVVAPDDQDTEMKHMLDRLHREKIDLSSQVIVVSDQTGYYGASTAAEIAYAESLNLPVIHWQVAPEQTPTTFRCPAPRICFCNNDPDEHQAFERHADHDSSGRDDCGYCEPAIGGEQR